MDFLPVLQFIQTIQVPILEVVTGTLIPDATVFT